MAKQMVNLNIPVLIRSNENKVYCPLFDTTFSLEDEPETTSTNNYSNVEIVPKLPMIKLSKIVDKLYILTKDEYETNHHLPESLPSSKYDQIRLNEGDFWLTYELEIEIDKKIFERILPIIFLSSAVIYQGLTLCTAAVSIYAKGLSVPVTLILSLSSALSAIINFTQADAARNIARIGHYLDHVSVKRSFNDLVNLKNKKQLFFSGFVFTAIVGGAIGGDATSIFSQTTIIDAVGKQHGLSFLSDDLIFIHGFLAASCGIIAYGTFGGNFAAKAATKFANWMYSIMNTKSEVTGGEVSPLISNPQF